MKLLYFFVRLLHRLRYHITLQGHELLEHDGPLLILPNHVALIDPRIVLSQLGKYRNISPLASEKFYNIPGIKQVMQAVGTIPIADASVSSGVPDFSQVYKNITQALQENKAVLIYPAGQIYRQGYESIKGKQAVYEIMKSLPENTKILALKDRGLWGSIWSMAWDNGQTSFGKAYLLSIWYVFVNFLFFVPKRDVSLRLFDITVEAKMQHALGMNALNHFLEDFFNSENGERYEEPLRYIPHYFYYNDIKNKTPPEYISGSEKELSKTNKVDTSTFSLEHFKIIQEKIAEMKGISLETLKPESKLILDLYFDSLDMAEIKSYLQAKFPQSSNPPITSLKTLEDLWAMIEGKNETQEALKPCDWGTTSDEKLLSEILKNTKNTNILTLWKRAFSESKETPFLWDNILGLQTRKEMILKAYVISLKLRELPESQIGIMLPAVGSASLLILASYLAGKTPVMFNWTLGKEAFDHCVKISEVTKILTASSFYTRVKNEFLEAHEREGRFVFAEDMLKNISLGVKLRALLKSTYIPLPKLPERAVLLFTSGSESLPKAVALSHQNIIENIIGALKIFELKNTDKIIGFLPPFHSFGFTVNTIMPLITGLQVAYTPDPNDAKTILEIMKHTRVTGVTATPTFLSMILSLAHDNDLENLKYAVVGAEKCPAGVFEMFQKYVPQGKILEGYGITECSPVVAINPVGTPKPGSVGKILPNLICQIRDIESGILCESGKQGMIYVSGSSIFSGYLDPSLASPFEVFDGVSYYKTGDLGYLDSDNYLYITGRLKRFVKIAGEMISLPFVEQILFEKYGSHEGVTFAVEALEENGNTKIVAFSTTEQNLDAMNAYLRERGVANIVKISEVQVLSLIPVLGTGKTDYKELKKMISFS